MIHTTPMLKPLQRCMPWHDYDDQSNKNYLKKEKVNLLFLNGDVFEARDFFFLPGSGWETNMGVHGQDGDSVFVIFG